jgi:hypothetical protein
MAEHLSEELAVAMVVVLDQQQAVARTIDRLQDVPRINESATRAVALGRISASVSLLGHRRVDNGSLPRELPGILKNSGQLPRRARATALDMVVQDVGQRKGPLSRQVSCNDSLTPSLLSM